MLTKKGSKTIKGPSLAQEYVELEETFHESLGNLTSLNEELSKSLTFQKMCTDIYQLLVDPHLDTITTSKQILSNIAQSLSLEGATIHLFTEDTDKLFLTASHGVSKEFLENSKDIYRDESILGYAAEKSDPIILHYNGVDIKKEKNKLVLKELLMLFLPILVKDELMGILTLLTTEGRPFTEEDRKRFSLLSHYLGLGFKNNVIFEETKKMATKDNLTDLHNRMYFNEFLTLELNRSQRYNKPLSLAIMDIDYFKRINDTYGHQVGDLILKEFADILKTSFRKTDLVARYGGEEFIAVFPEANMNNAKRVASKLQKRLNEHFFIGNGKKHKITISMGISAVTPEKKISQQELILQADKALYSAKESGRNTVKVWSV